MDSTKEKNMPVIIRWTDCSLVFNIPDVNLFDSSKFRVTFKQGEKRIVITTTEIIDETHIRVLLSRRQTGEFKVFPPYATVDVNFIDEDGRQSLADGKNHEKVKVKIVDNNYDEEIE